MDFKQLIADGQKVAALASEAQQKVAEYEQKTAELQTENRRLREQIETRGTTIKLAAEEAADFFNQHGVLKSDDRQAFVDRAIQSPAAVLKLAQDFSDRCADLRGQVGVGQPEIPGDSKTAAAHGSDDGRDAVDRFIHS